jgi:hypothetical protein
MTSLSTFKGIPQSTCPSPKFCSVEISAGYALLFLKEDTIAT